MPVLPTDLPTNPDNPCPTGEAALRCALDQVAGLDTVTGLRNTGGKLAAYIRVLEMFIANHLDAPAELRAALAGNRNDDARRIAHTLKGASRTLGLTSVGNCAAEIESDIGSAHSLTPLIDEIEGFLQAFASELRKATSR